MYGCLLLSPIWTILKLKFYEKDITYISYNWSLQDIQSTINKVVKERHNYLKVATRDKIDIKSIFHLQMQ